MPSHRVTHRMPQRPDGGGYQLVTSAMRSFGSPGTLAVDVPAPTAVLDKVSKPTSQPASPG